MATTIPPPIATVSIRRRVCLSFAWTIFGLVFFYLVMVACSTLSKNITLERLRWIGWPRSASRHTGAVTSVVFSLFLLTPASSMWSLFLAVMVACAHFAHFVIITSDLRVYEDKEVVIQMFRTEETHPLYRILPLWTAHVVGTIGFFAMLVISNERCYGTFLRDRKGGYPIMTRISVAWVWAVFNLWFWDRLIGAVLSGKGQDAILYPASFLACLWVSGIVFVIRERRWESRNILVEGKKTN